MQREAYHPIPQFINYGSVASGENGLITFINKRARTILGFGKKKISPLTLSLMQAYPFRGNVRELKNLIKRAIILSEGDRIDSFILSSIGNDVLEEWNQATPKEKEINKRIKA